jgi:hypothetical protein
LLRAAQDALAAERLGVAPAARDQRVAQRGDVGAGADLDVLARTERLAHRGEVAHRDLHAEQLRQRQVAHRVARRDRLPGRVVDQAVGPDRRRQHRRALVAEEVEPAGAVAANAQELAPAVGLRPGEVGAHRDRPRRQLVAPAGAAAPAGRRAGR